MKLTIKVNTYLRPTNAGYPIVLELHSPDGRHKKTIGHSLPEYWNFEKQLPLKSHPRYAELTSLILEYRGQFAKIRFNELSYSEALQILFNKQPRSPVFKTEVLQLCDTSKNGKLYKTVINSFELVYPGILIDRITPKHARDYMALILEKQSPNGVHTYLRTLSALFTKVSELPNPFKGVRPKKTRTPNKALPDPDIIKLISTRTLPHKYDGQNDHHTVNYPRYYWMLMFYLGGIDFIDLAQLRYDHHVKNGRVIFKRHKGSSEVMVNNLILPEAAEILEYFDCEPYLIPAYRYADHNDYLNRCNKALRSRTEDLQLTMVPLSKSARYSFITRAQQQLIDERITMEIVGHTQTKIHSIYTDEFPLVVRDAAHKKIVDLKLGVDPLAG